MQNMKDKFASGAGCVLEWYEFSLYGYFAPLLAKLYFPNQHQHIAITNIFIIFAVGYLARPLGALILGHISDKYGRITTLKLTPILITIPTVLMVFLPTYNQIGVCAPILLAVLRLLQGFSIGGEFTNNIVYLCETAEAKRRYFFGSIGACTGNFGILLASSVAAICYKFIPPDKLMTFGWRLALSVSIFIGVFTYILRRNIKETPIYQNIAINQKTVKNPLVESYKNQKNDYIVAIGIGFFGATAFYFVFMFLPNYTANYLGISSANMLGNNSFSLLIHLFLIPAIGLISDRLGGIFILRLVCTLFIVFSYPIFYGFVHNPSAIVYFYILALMTTLASATTPGLIIGMLKPETRCTIFSFAFNICFGVFGGLTPSIGFLLKTKFGSNMVPVYYLIFAALITLFFSFLTKSGLSNVKKLSSNLN